MMSCHPDAGSGRADEPMPPWHVRAVLLEVTGLSARYGKVAALSGASLTLRAGQIVTVIGPNGAGKSTLLNAIMGACPRAPQPAGGSLPGRRCQPDGCGERVARGLSLVPEKRELFGTMSVEDNLLLGAFQRRRNGEPATWTSRSSSTPVPRLKERRRQAAGTLSGGERQMLAVGRALMAKPQLLMLDEPSLGLAPLIVRGDLPHHQPAAQHRRVHPAGRAERPRRLQVADYAYVLEMGEIACKARPQPWRRPARRRELGLASH
jgi:branched-chain amino acid transport system ATP-binding protein